MTLAAQFTTRVNGTSPLWIGAALAFILLVVFVVFIVSVSMRRYLSGEAKSKGDQLAPPPPNIADGPSFLHASMQGVIQQLREQEKELERLHRQEKERVWQTERLSEAVTRNMPTGLLLVSAPGLITVANPAAEAALGMKTLSYRRYDEALGAGSTLTRFLNDCLRKGQTFQREVVEHVTPGGDVRQLGVTISPVLAPPPHLRGSVPTTTAGQYGGALCLLSDLTEMTALQKQVRLKESLALLGELSAGIAHEFKNALATISGYAQMLRSEATTAEQTESAEKIVKETRALTHLVTEFLRFAKPLDFLPAEVEVGPLVERICSDLHEELPSADFVVEGEFGTVLGDEGLLRQVLLNLARNAAEAAAEKQGMVRVTLRGALETGTARGAQQIAVRDNGPGIPEADLAKIFLPFYTTKADGTGLGLAVVQKIAVQHGGSVSVRNLPEGGAEFLLTLPMKHPAGIEAVDSTSGRI